MKKFISLISAAALVITSVSAMNLNGSSVMAEDDAVKIMCIGDSITDGYTYEYTGSYRKFIYHNLTEKGYNIDMVGSKGDGWIPTYTDSETGESWEFDNDNTGYSGYSIINYSGRSGIYETLQSTGCLASEAPDIVTLQIGTNDIIDNHEIDMAGERLEILVDYILENIPESSTLFISPVPPLDPNRSDVYDWFGNYRHSSDWSEQYNDNETEMNVNIAVMKYNTQVMALAEKKKQEGKNVVFSEAAFEITDVKTQLFDGVHPNNTGYKAIGDYWSEILDNYLSGPEINPPVSETTTTTATTAAETTTETTVQTTTETTDLNNEDDSFKVSDLVKLTRYVLGIPSETDEGTERYDLNSDGRLDVYDVILMRRFFIDTGKELREKFGDDFCLIENIGYTITDDEWDNGGITKITSGSSASSSVSSKDFSESSDKPEWNNTDNIIS